MHGVTKIGAVYSSPFWDEDEGLSGSSNVHADGNLFDATWDSSDKESKVYGIAGFSSGNADGSPITENQAVDSLVALFGDKATTVVNPSSLTLKSGIGQPRFTASPRLNPARTGIMGPFHLILWGGFSFQRQNTLLNMVILRGRLSV
jgi:hypothetical protein